MIHRNGWGSIVRFTCTKWSICTLQPILILTLSLFSTGCNARVKITNQLNRSKLLAGRQQQLYILPGDGAPHSVSKGEPCHSTEETYFVHLNLGSCFGDHYPTLITIDKGRNVYWTVNHDLAFPLSSVFTASYDDAWDTSPLEVVTQTDLERRPSLRPWFCIDSWPQTWGRRWSSQSLHIGPGSMAVGLSGSSNVKMIKESSMKKTWLYRSKVIPKEGFLREDSYLMWTTPKIQLKHHRWIVGTGYCSRPDLWLVTPRMGKV